MPLRFRPSRFIALGLSAFALTEPILCNARADNSPPPAARLSGAACGTDDHFFRDQVWTKVGAQSCLECHKTGGDAEDSEFILQDPARDTTPERHASLKHNEAAFQRMARRRKGDESRILLKATGKLDHGGEDVLKPDSTAYRILAEFVRRQDPSAKGAVPVAATPRQAADFFAGISMLDNRQLLRRLTLSLAGRLPTAEELARVEKEGLPAIPSVLDGVLREDVFFIRLAEAFNDIFLVRGYDDGAESALAYEHFSATRIWNQKYDLSHIADEKARQQARYKLADDYREALLREPLELVKHIVRENRPFSEIVTADYIMVSPYTARGYGLFEELKGRFRNVDDPFEYISVRLPALKGRSAKTGQPSETGFYPHAGMISIFQYLRRYPTTETNRNRLRARMYYQHFLGVDVLELAARVTDAAAVTAKYEVPTMQAAECVVCHRTLDPVAGLFQDYYSFEGVYGPRKEGWYKDMFGAGFEGEDMPSEQRWRALQWLGERTVKDPRFATTMVEHAYYVLTGRRPLLPPKGIDDPLFDARQRAYRVQRLEVERIAAEFVKSNFDFKTALKAWAVSPFYRADAVQTSQLQPEREVELADVGLARMLSPEQLERKVAAIFAKPWGRLKDTQYTLLYGGIDSKEVTERATDPSGAMGAIQRMMANEVACKNVPADFRLDPPQRRLFPNIEPSVLPGSSPEGDERIRTSIAHLHRTVLGRDDTPASEEVARSFALFADVVREGQAAPGVDDLEIYHCRSSGEGRDKDPDYTIRGWRAVVTYLLRRREFLYE